VIDMVELVHEVVTFCVSCVTNYQAIPPAAATLLGVGGAAAGVAGSGGGGGGSSSGSGSTSSSPAQESRPPLPKGTKGPHGTVSHGRGSGAPSGPWLQSGIDDDGFPFVVQPNGETWTYLPLLHSWTVDRPDGTFDSYTRKGRLSVHGDASGTTQYSKDGVSFSSKEPAPTQPGSSSAPDTGYQHPAAEHGTDPASPKP